MHGNTISREFIWHVEVCQPASEFDPGGTQFALSVLWVSYSMDAGLEAEVSNRLN
jgi:hypothetical protein